VRGDTSSALLGQAGLDVSTLDHAIPALTTMEVAWILSGLLHADDAKLQKARSTARQELLRRLVPRTLVFRHASVQAPWTQFLRMHIANFADQIYPVQALAFAAKARGDHEALDLADSAAARLVKTQGPMGQWWWHHSPVTGEIIGEYPVYSVHQHSMAPMALHCLHVAGGKNHEAAERGRAWLRHNELGIDMVDDEQGIIWRSVELSENPFRRSARKLGALVGKRAKHSDHPPLRLNREIRPYEWGWLLYVNALEFEQKTSGHII
jgi:hypothetical protein